MKNKNLLFYFVVLSIIILLTYRYINTIRINSIVAMTVFRGIITEKSLWWYINDYFPDSTGYNIYQVLKKQERFVPVNIMGKRLYLLTELSDIHEMLYFSPNPFGPGDFKKDFFSSFMKRNVGISEGKEWIARRKYNDKVLETDRPHSMNDIFSEYIYNMLSNNKPTTFFEFRETSKKITSKIMFGTYEYNNIIYKIFNQADSVMNVSFGIKTINQKDFQEYEEYLKQQLETPKPNTLLYIGNKYHRIIPEQDIIEQIPHWIFPIVGIFTSHLPRLLVLLLNHPKDFDIVKREIKDKKYFLKTSYIRKCILELFRLNNIVNSTFRKLSAPYQFSNYNRIFNTGDEFVYFNNSVLRDLFEEPHQFIPSRWNEKTEEEYRALMFNHDNQRCPGKELTISLLTYGCIHYLEMCNFNLKTNIKLNNKFIPYLINPCSIKFTLYE